MMAELPVMETVSAAVPLLIDDQGTLRIGEMRGDLIIDTSKGEEFPWLPKCCGIEIVRCDRGAGKSAKISFIIPAVSGHIVKCRTRVLRRIATR